MGPANANISNDKGFTIPAKVVSRQRSCSFGHEVGDRSVFEIRRIRE